jgi:acetyl/propionyl-CoA carboxylase alpha subunit
MRKILVANRGEIAVRVIDTCRKMNIASVAVFSEADRGALHMDCADEAVCVGPPPVEDSYLDPARILRAARDTGAEGIHPGYGFLSENADFARAVQGQGLTWIGPSPTAMETMASKIRSREIAVDHGVPVVPALAFDADQQPDLQAVAALGFPLLIKASAGGGGIGMREVHEPEDLESALEEAGAQALRQFGDGSLLVERLVAGARHVEVQVVGDSSGNLLHLYDRDCSLQRRRQKLIEEAPAPGLPAELRNNLHSAALRLAAAVDYQGVGTVEFLVQGEDYYLLEMNTRLQVEHGVTEAVLGLDLVQMQIEIARGQALSLKQDEVIPRGHAIEARVYAEDPLRQFAPATGTVVAFHAPTAESIRIDTGIVGGEQVSHYYDGLLCKLIASGSNRVEAGRSLCRSLENTCIAGVTTNQRFLRALLQDSSWNEVAMHTTEVEERLPDYLAQSEIPEQDAQTALMAATVWQFLRSPPDADRAPWPGGFQYRRNSHWNLGARNHCLDWRWCSADSFHFTGSDDELRVLDYDASRPDLLKLEIHGVQRTFHCHADDDALTVHEPALGNVALHYLEPGSQREQAEDPSSCISAGPGLVLKVLVEPGQLVSTGDDLLVIESMKMESTLSSRCAGRVGEIHARVGALVETGELLLSIEAVSEEAG